MNVAIVIDGVARTTNVLVDSLRITDHINEQANEADFTAVDYRPSVGDEITITDDGTTIFAGVILRITQRIRGIRVEYDIQCKDWTHYLDRKLVTERYKNTNVASVISSLISNYTSGFSTNNVSGPQPIDNIAFNRIPVSQCIQRLAENTSYSWYVDYNKDIHFFSKNTESAPFNLTNTGGNHVWQSLSITEDITQLRNRIYVEGGENTGNQRTEIYEADGDQLQFPLSNKFAEKPSVTVNSTSQTVGVDYIDDESSADCFWSFQEKYIRFKSATQPANGDTVEITGIPLFPIIVNVPSNTSINTYGEYQFKITDKSIQSRDTAVDRARAELQAYAQTIEEGSFHTYRSGLSSGQVISITAAGIDGSFLIQSVKLSMRTPYDGLWRVKVASLRTIGAIDFLTKLLRDDEIRENEAETLLNLLSFSDAGEGTDSFTMGTRVTSGPYYVSPDNTGNQDPGLTYAKVNYSKVSA
jgi:hypothetical protein